MTQQSSLPVSHVGYPITNSIDTFSYSKFQSSKVITIFLYQGTPYFAESKDPEPSSLFYSTHKFLATSFSLWPGGSFFKIFLLVWQILPRLWSIFWIVQAGVEWIDYYRSYFPLNIMTTKEPNKFSQTNFSRPFSCTPTKWHRYHYTLCSTSLS